MLISSVGIIVRKGTQVLLVQKTSSPDAAWQLPGGQVETNETGAAAAVRELHEITGLRTTIADLRLLSQEWRATITRNYGTAEFHWQCFVCLKYEGEVMVTAAAQPRWVEPAELDSLHLLPNTKQAIAAAEHIR